MATDSEFYQLQNRWTGIYEVPIGDHHRDKAAKVSALMPESGGQTLELGAGGGQITAVLASMGHRATALDLNPDAVAHARSLAAPHGELMTVLEGDFYTIDPGGPFDVVAYWDGFGVGTDADQKQLLGRIASWLAPGGTALLEIYTPWYWAACAGRGGQFGDAHRVYGFDAMGCRLLDTWWLEGQREGAVTQSLRCYSPADLGLLLDGTGLDVVAVAPGGAMDHERKVWLPTVPLERAMAFTATLKARA